ncbi:hypothetical protein ABZ128_07865 [Streptomyces sp. NPDC006326]|uniref:hypothetical protein n=1 Tax=Streptomyces sp. NPDC006326 TaxID=3156752 RepID=UPI0033AE3A44
MLLFGWLGHRLAGPGNNERRRVVARCILTVGLLMVALGFPVFFDPSWWAREVLGVIPQGAAHELLPSLVVALGAALVIFGLQLRWGPTGHGPDRRTPTTRRLLLVGEGLLLGVLTMSLFFDAARYATMAGESEGWRDALKGFTNSPVTVVYSSVRLGDSPPGVQFTDLGSGSGPYRYRYNGFRILVKSSSRFYLVTREWLNGRATVVLPDDDSVRVVVGGK